MVPSYRMQISTFDVCEKPLKIRKILGGEARGRKKVRTAVKWDSERSVAAMAVAQRRHP
jgi:hypothetical protein